MSVDCLVKCVRSFCVFARTILRTETRAYPKNGLVHPTEETITPKPDPHRLYIHIPPSGEAEPLSLGRASIKTTTTTKTHSEEPNWIIPNKDEQQQHIEPSPEIPQFRITQRHAHRRIYHRNPLYSGWTGRREGHRRTILFLFGVVCVSECE